MAEIWGFNRSWLPYKKKYNNILAEYRNNKRANEISGSDRKQECRWYDKIDTWNSKRASVHNQTPTSAQEGDEIYDTSPTTPKTL